MLGPTQLAKALGTSRQMIYQYEREGKLPARVDGGWDLAEVHKRLSETLGSKCGGVPKRGTPEAVKDEPKAAPATKPKKVREISASSEITVPEAINPEDLDKVTKNDLEKAVLAHRAEKMRLENEKIRGELVSAEDVRQAQTERAMAERESLLNWPARIAPEMAAKFGVPERDMFITLDVEVRKYLESRSTLAVQEKAA